jgi:uncharacterized protein YbaP (TraB family)
MPAPHRIMERATRLLRKLAAALGLVLAGGAAPAAEPDCPPIAQTPSAAQIEAGLKQARDRGFLWRIARDGRHSWLYGTLHVARLEWTLPGPRLTEVLREVKAIALELDLADASLQLRIGQRAGASEPPLPPALRQRLAQRARAECLPPGALDTLPATLQAATLASLVGRRDGLDPAYAIDAMLAGFGHAAGRRVVALETLDAQLDALQGGSPDAARHFVERTLAELDGGRTRLQVRRIAQAWASGDLATLERFAQWCQCMERPDDVALMRRLLDERNLAMAERIEALHRESAPVLAAVGSLHFVGPRGLAALLAARGFTIERIAFKP